MTTTYTYSDYTLRLTDLNSKKQTTLLQKFEYTYDDVGNVSVISDHLNKASQGFQYDDLNRLVKATGSYTPTDPAYTWNECTFDANGNMKSSPGKTMTYDMENRITQVAMTSAGTVSFTYDYAGTRVNKNVNSGTENTTYVSDLYEIKEAEGDTTGTKYIYANGTKVASKSWKQSDGTKKIYYYHGDHLGSSNIITDESGELAQLLEYMPYGLTNTNEGTVDVDYKFTGKELDDSTGLYYYGARYYDPVLGRFITPDTIVQAPYDPQSLNRYAYCRNNPVKYVDPTGHITQTMLDSGTGEATVGSDSSNPTGHEGGESKCFGEQSTPQGSGNTTDSSSDGSSQEGETSNSKKMEGEGDDSKKEEEKSLWDGFSMWLDKHTWRGYSWTTFMQGESTSGTELRDVNSLGTLVGFSMDFSFGDIPGPDDLAIEFGIGLGKHLGIGFQQFGLNPSTGKFSKGNISIHIGWGLGSPLYITGTGEDKNISNHPRSTYPSHLEWRNKY